MKLLTRIPRGFWAGITLVIVCNVAIVALQAYQARVHDTQLEESRQSATDTLGVISEILALDRSLQDSERGQRGYLLTGRDEYLRPYQDSLAAIPSHIARLKELTADNPEQQRRWPLLEQQVAVKLEELRRSINTYQTQGFGAAREVVQTDVGLNSMIAIQGLMDAALSTENALLAQRTTKNVEAYRTISHLALITALVALAGVISGLLFATFAARHIVKTHDRLDQTKAQLAQAQKLEALGQLTGGIAHDFNNLLQGITGGISLLQRRLPASPETANWISMIKRNADRAASLTQRLLAFSRRQPLNPKPLDLNKIIAGMTDLLRQSLGENISIETVLGGGLWFTEADAPELETAVLNLAINARDAMPDGGKLTLETSNTFLDEAYSASEGTKPGQYVMVAVSDTGQGMSVETAQKVFEPFFTTKSVGKGTGLGLSQVYGFVKQSAGHVKIYSELGQGTTVKMYFPRLTSSVAEQPQEAVHARDREQHSESILVVEDDADVRLFAATVLSEDGYRVTTAHDAESALRVLERDPDIHLMLTDVGLPGDKNGRHLADEARGRYPNLQVVFMTGYARNAIIHGGRLDPGVELIVKPFSEKVLTEKLRAVLGKSAGQENA